MILDLFAGPGGWSQGLRDLGFSDIGIEFDQYAAETRRLNGFDVVEADITTLSPRDYRHADMIIASPPCQPYSASGNKLGEDDPRGKLVWTPLDWIKGIRPRLIALEQVPTVQPIWDHYALHLLGTGYRVWTGTLDVSDYGCPTRRKRAILVARRDGKAVGRPRPTNPPDRRVTMYDAIGWGWRDRPCNSLTSRGYAGGTSSRRAVANAIRNGHFTPGPLGVEPGGQPRMSVAEMAKLQTFPDSFKFAGGITSQRLQIADAVPPRFAKEVLRQLVA